MNACGFFSGTSMAIRPYAVVPCPAELLFCWAPIGNPPWVLLSLGATRMVVLLTGSILLGLGPPHVPFGPYAPVLVLFWSSVKFCNNPYAHFIRPLLGSTGAPAFASGHCGYKNSSLNPRSAGVVHQPSVSPPALPHMPSTSGELKITSSHICIAFKITNCGNQSIGKG